MKQLVCEMCESNNVIKQDGLFVCQSCNTKYSVEEAKKMMIEGTVQVAGTVKIDNRDIISNYLLMARNAYESDNYEEAEKYVNKIIEIDHQNYDAWLLKGHVSPWQSNLNNVRFTEALSAWSKALALMPDDMRNDSIASIMDAVVKFMHALTATSSDIFTEDINNENLLRVVGFCDKYVEHIESFVLKNDINFNMMTIHDVIANILYNAADKANTNANKNFGNFGYDKSQMTEYDWEKYLAEKELCVALFEKAIEFADDNDEFKFIVFDRLISVAKEANKSSAYGYQYDTERYVQSSYFVGSNIWTQQIKNWQKKKTLVDPEIKAAREEELRQKERFKKYWIENSEEKERLNKLKQEMSCEIRSLLSEKINLGLFKIKEKKALQVRIDTIHKKINDIDYELSKPR